MPPTFDTTKAVRQSEWASSPYGDSIYVWLHVDNAGVPFYAGRGRGSTAWDRNGGPAWEYYVTHRLGGSYHVIIPSHGLGDQESQSVLETLLETYGPLLLNQANYSRGMDYAAYAQRRELEQELKPLYAEFPKAETIEQRVLLARRGLELQYQINGIRLETGLFGEILHEMGADCSINMFFIKPLIEGLVEKGLVDDAREALADFTGRAPRQATTSTIRRLQKIADRGTLVRRKPASAP